MFLIDSDYLINFLNGKTSTIQAFDQIKTKPLHTSVINIGEVLIGLQDPTPTNQHLIKEFNEIQQTLTVINIDTNVIEQFVKIKYFLKKNGLLIENFDLLIAATCLAYNLTLVTNNHKHFQRIPKLKMYFS